MPTWTWHWSGSSRAWPANERESKTCRSSKKSGWAAGHQAVEQEGQLPGMSVSRVCQKLGMTRQNYYARRRRRQGRQVDGELVAGLVQRERRLQPRLGTRKLYHLLKSELKQAGVRMGRDRMFEELRQRDL